MDKKRKQAQNRIPVCGVLIAGYRFGLCAFAPLFLWLLMLHSSCNKLEDEIPPVVEIFKPNEEQVFTVGDSIFVSGIASDETQLTSIVVALTDHQFIVRDQQINLEVTGNPQSFSFWYPTTNLLMPDGDYYIQIRASDGVNTKYKYRKIRIEQGIRTLQNLLVITKSGSNSFRLSTIDTTFSGLVSRRLWMHDYVGSGINWYANQLIVMGREIGACYAIDLDDFAQHFSIPAQGTPSLQHYESLLTAHDRFYTGLTDGIVYGYNTDGKLQFSSTLVAPRKPLLMALHYPDFLLMAEQERTAPGSWITATWLTSGLPWKVYQLPDNFAPVSLIPLNNDEVLLAGNLNGVGQLIVWNITQSSISTPLVLSNGAITSLLQTADDQFLISTSHEILSYRLGQQLPITWMPLPGVVKMRVHHEARTLFAGLPNQITAYHMDTKHFLWQLPVAETLADFHLHFQ
jgi:hypothetical protein